MTDENDTSPGTEKPQIGDVICGPTNEQIANHEANILLLDLIHLHRDVTEIDELSPRGLVSLSKHLIKIIQSGSAYELLNEIESKKTFMDGKGRFLEKVVKDETVSFIPMDDKDKLTFVKMLVQQVNQNHHADSKDESTNEEQSPIGSSKVKTDETVGDDGVEPERSSPKSTNLPVRKVSTDNACDESGSNESHGNELKPNPDDILLVYRGDRGDESNGKHSDSQQGITRLLEEVNRYATDEYMPTSKGSRSNAAISIVKKLEESSRFLVRTGKDSWEKLGQAKAAEWTLILLFDKLLEKEDTETSESQDGPAISLALVDDDDYPDESFSNASTVPIKSPTAHDVLFGRGGLTNNHPGNRRFRDIISLHRPDYIRAIKVEKPNVARRIVKAIRCGTPPGRFLKKGSDNGMWYDVGDRHAAEKTSQALREKSQGEKGSNDEDNSRKRPRDGPLPYFVNRPPNMRMTDEPHSMPLVMIGTPNFQIPPPFIRPQASLGVPSLGPHGLVARMPNVEAMPPNSVSAELTRTASNTKEKTATKGGFKPDGSTDGPSLPSKEQRDGKTDDTNDVERSSSEGSIVVNELNELMVVMTGNTETVDRDGNIMVTDNDILCGRGGLTNHHFGNKRFRDIVGLHRPDYVRASKIHKPAVARLIVRAIRNSEPPGRFLKKDEKTGKWYDIGDKRAAEKASQALREKSPEERYLSKRELVTVMPPSYYSNPELFRATSAAVRSVVPEIAGNEEKEATVKEEVTNNDKTAEI